MFARIEQVQLIVELPVDAEEYASQDLQRRMAAPTACPHCHANNSLEALGYYLRSVTGKDSLVLRLSIRRFRCKSCGRTVSLLPDFAQPYRLVHNQTIHRFFCGQRRGGKTKPWLTLLRRYWKKFTRWVSQLGAILHSRLDHAPPPRRAAAWWELVVAEFGDMAAATRVLVTDREVTLFGKYRCHRPNVRSE